MHRSKLSQPAAVAETHSAISIVNAIGTGFGATIGISIPCKVEASLIPIENDEHIIVQTSAIDKHGLVTKCVDYVETYLSARAPKEYQLRINIDSKIPVAVGLKSSSAISTAVVSAIGKLLGKEIDSETVLKLSCNASKDSHASITGAYDDAVSCLLGGLVLADNLHYRIIKHTNIPKDLGAIVLVRVPLRSKVYTSSIYKNAYSKFTKNSKVAFELAMKGDIRAAMLMNSLVQCSVLGYSFEPIIIALREGATCVGISGKGPALAALCTTNKIADRVEKDWRKMKDEPQFRIIKTTTFDARDTLT